MPSLLIVILLLLLKVFLVLGSKCGIVDSPGYTERPGDIYLEEGSNLHINCTLYEISPSQNSHNLFWQKSPIPESLTVCNKVSAPLQAEIISNDTAQLTIANVSLCDTAYYNCKLNDTTAVCGNAVVVGFPPPKYKKINCVSENWKTMNCSWSHRKNPVKIVWNFTYVENRNRIPVNCKSYDISNSEERHECIFNATMLAMPKFHISLNGSNRFENVTTEYSFPVDKHVILDSPKLRKSDNISQEVTIYGQIVSKEKLDLNCIINYKCMRKNCEVFAMEKFVPATRLNSTGSSAQKEVNFNVNIKNLLPFNTYSVWVKCQLNITAIPEYWSKETKIMFNTSKEVPEISPILYTGGYEQSVKNEMRNVTLFWQEIDRNYVNGETVRYEIKCANRTWASSNSSKFIMNLSTNSSYNFIIKACNEIGCSHNTSSIFVPEVKQEYPRLRVYAARNFSSQNKYEISWNLTTPNDKLRYVIFKFIMKDSNTKDHEVCAQQGLVKVREVQNKTSENITIEPSENCKFEIAVAAINDNYSGGLTWIPCFKSSNDSVQVVNIKILETGSTWAYITWEMKNNCILKNTVGYNITYKELNKKTENNKLISDAFATSINLTGLVPKSHYSLTIIVYGGANSKPPQSFEFQTKDEQRSFTVTTNNNTIVIAIVISLFGFIGLILIALYLVRKVKLKIKELKNIQVPTGLREDANSYYTPSIPPANFADFLTEKVELPLITTVIPSPPCEKLTNGSHSSGFGSDCPESATSSPTMSFNWNHPTTELDTPKIIATDEVFDYPMVDPVLSYSQLGSFPIPSLQTLDVSALQAFEREPVLGEETVSYAKLGIIPYDDQQTDPVAELIDRTEIPSLIKGYTSVTASDLMLPYVKLALNETTEFKKEQIANNNTSTYLSVQSQGNKIESGTCTSLPSDARLECVGPGYVTCKSLTGPIADSYVRLGEQNEFRDNEVFLANDEELDEISLHEYFETNSNHSNDTND